MISTELDENVRINSHSAALDKKPVLRDVFTDIHKALRGLDEKWFGSTPGDRIEIGSGVCPMRDVYPDTLATDVVPAEHLDEVIDAQDINRQDGSVRTVYLQNAFHHIPDPEAFFVSAQKVIAPGGGIIMLEPHWGPIAGLIFPRLFKSEGYDKKQIGWEQKMTSSMDGANQALSYVVLQRDYDQFKAKFPELELVARGVSPTYMRYVLSGGLNFPQLLPSFLFPVVRGIEFLTSPISRFTGLHQWIVIRKK